MARRKRLLAFGEVLFDVINGKAHLGGAPFNLAAHFARHNNFSALISSVGSDELGEHALAGAAHHGVDTSFVRKLQKYETGKVEVKLSQGQPEYTILQPVAWDYIELNTQEFNVIESADWDCFCFGLLAQRNAISEKTLHLLLDNIEFKLVFLDINLRKNFFTLPKIEYSLSKCNILKLNDDEVKVLSSLLFYEVFTEAQFSGMVSKKYNIDTVIVTMGAKGAMVYHNGETNYSPAQKVIVADTVGAGDSFSAAFLNEFIESGNHELALEKACKLGAYVASKNGAIPDYDFQ